MKMKMETFRDYLKKGYHEGGFDKKSKGIPDEEELQRLGMKSAGRGGWDKKEQEETEDEPEMKNDYEQRNDPDHPYCTNWPMNKKGKNEEI